MAKPVGKGQQAIINYLKRGGSVDLADMASDPAFRGMHFGGIEQAADALVKKGMIKRKGNQLSMASLRLSGKQQAEVIATLLKSGRRDLVKQLIVTASGHHHKEGKDYYADTAFMNSIPREAGTLKHMGFGEFTLVQRDGTEIEFDRMRGKDFPGQSGRSHQLYDNKGGKGVAALIKLMEQKKASERV